ncbi:hypothetical protein [Clostridium sp.]|uniref:hypothetical protein n=1 Tax=Clostridium sp. TaxID=1506 RepID=UPI003F3E74E0
MKYSYNYKSNTTTYRCDICQEWYYKDEVSLIDCNGCNTDDVDTAEKCYCHSCYDNNF